MILPGGDITSSALIGIKRHTLDHVYRMFARRYLYTFVGLLTLATVILFLAGPLLVAAPIATVTISKNTQHIVLSGHRFQCDGSTPQKALVRCTTSLKGKSLEIEFTYSRDYWAVLTCKAKYDRRVLPCSGYHDYRLRADQVDVSIGDSLGLTGSDRWLLWLENPLVNVPQEGWNSLPEPAAVVVSTLLGVGVWLRARRRSSWEALIASVCTVALLVIPIYGFLTLLLLARYVD